MPWRETEVVKLREELVLPFLCILDQVVYHPVEC